MLINDLLCTPSHSQVFVHKQMIHYTTFHVSTCTTHSEANFSWMANIQRAKNTCSYICQNKKNSNNSSRRHFSNPGSIKANSHSFAIIHLNRSSSMAIPDLNTPQRKEELPNLNNKPTQEEDDGPLQDVVGAGEGGGPCFTLPLSPSIRSECQSPWRGHQYKTSLWPQSSWNWWRVFHQGKHTICIQKIIVLVLFFSLLSHKICVMLSLSPKNSAIVLNLYLSSPKIIVCCFHFCPKILIAESSNRCHFFLIEVSCSILKCLCISPKTLVYHIRVFVIPVIPMTIISMENKKACWEVITSINTKACYKQNFYMKRFLNLKWSVIFLSRWI